MQTENQWTGLNRLEYGLGLGIGIDVWKLQVIGRYNWNFGVLGNYKDFLDVNPGGIKIGKCQVFCPEWKEFRRIDPDCFIPVLIDGPYEEDRSLLFCKF